MFLSEALLLRRNGRRLRDRALHLVDGRLRLHGQRDDKQCIDGLVPVHCDVYLTAQAGEDEVLEDVVVGAVRTVQEDFATELIQLCQNTHL